MGTEGTVQSSVRHDDFNLCGEHQIQTRPKGMQTQPDAHYFDMFSAEILHSIFGQTRKHFNQTRPEFTNLSDHTNHVHSGHKMRHSTRVGAEMLSEDDAATLIVSLISLDPASALLIVAEISTNAIWGPQ